MNENQNKETKVSQPFIIQIENLTDEKIYGVKLFEEQFKEQEKIRYSTTVIGLEYSDILQKFFSNENKEQITIGLFYLQASCGYNVFQRRQLNIKCLIDSGENEKQELDFVIDPYQQQDSIVATTKKVEFKNKTNITIPYLMPETKIRLMLYPSSISKPE
jgi:hypothetical protein